MRAQVRFFHKYLPPSKKRRQFLAWAEKYSLVFWEEGEIAWKIIKNLLPYHEHIAKKKERIKLEWEK